MKRLLTIALGLTLTTALLAQPAKKRTLPSVKAKTEQAAQQQSVRRFPASPKMSDDVTWRRDIYRTLDLTKDANAPLYYPNEPVGKQMNLFTYVFRLLLAGRINAYNYSLDGNENFDQSNQVKVRDLMERYGIFYEEKDGKLTVAAQDIPSTEVTRYYIKESSFFDQRTSIYSQRVTAICPVLMRGADEFSTDATPYPLFWLNYEEVANYLSRLPVMGSNRNNVTNMTADDFFTMNLYEGEIYKTNNMQGRVLAKDSTLVREQKRIEKELKDFEAGIWTTQKPDTVKADTTAVAPTKADKKAAAKSKAKESKSSASSSRRNKAAASKAVTTSRVSARRQRR